MESTLGNKNRNERESGGEQYCSEMMMVLDDYVSKFILQVSDTRREKLQKKERRLGQMSIWICILNWGTGKVQIVFLSVFSVLTKFLKS